MWNIIQSEKARKFCLPEGIMLGEISQTTHKRTDTVSSHLDQIPREVEFRDRKQKGGCQRLRGGNRELFFKEYGVSVLQDEKSYGSWLQINVNELNTTELYIQKWSKCQIVCYAFFFTIVNKQTWYSLKADMSVIICF